MPLCRDITVVNNLPPYCVVQHFIDLGRLTHTNQNCMMLKYLSYNEHLEWRYIFVMMEIKTCTRIPEMWT